MDLGSTDLDELEELVDLNCWLKLVHLLVGESRIVSEVDFLDLGEVFQELCQEIKSCEVFTSEV